MVVLVILMLQSEKELNLLKDIKYKDLTWQRTVDWSGFWHIQETLVWDWKKVMNKLSPGRAEEGQDEREKRGKWKESREKLCKVLNVKTISFDVMNIGWEAEGSEDGREGRWLWINGLEGMRAEAWRGESFSETGVRWLSLGWKASAL